MTRRAADPLLVAAIEQSFLARLPADLTAMVGERTLAGAFTPAQAFGPDLVLQIDGVSRRDLVDGARS